MFWDDEDEDATMIVFSLLSFPIGGLLLAQISHPSFVAPGARTALRVGMHVTLRWGDEGRPVEMFWKPRPKHCKPRTTYSGTSHVLWY